ncbi:MFS transporter [Ralstonia solanacearum]|uniref:MFS transporter n=1 Tax=Ralstonia solanacearum K60 TaxID=1091042 RepID=A0AAP7ZPN8_RALSL|nr:MFS transporter [Ralstonia solanacearum]MBT1538656.1 MFS transporter [Ralstonia solanacearum]OYQ14460.1 MFS transporter [Ralstonia solanacearum K60]RIJ85781.1 MFS transporter [Ralstonia solanacearum]CCF98886.1 putative multidrug-efflux transporter, Permeases (mdtG) [Ralstonia solanacearum K60]
MVQVSMDEQSVGQWRRNLAVCFFGAFATVFAMTLILPFLPVYVGQLGVAGHAAVVQWSGIAYSATFVTAGLVAPIWGMLGDRYGRKPMLVRASLGMALTMSLMGLATDIWQFVGLRLLAGIAGGYSSGATILIAVQAPKARSAWALGLLSSGVMAGNLLGPLAGGSLPPLIGIRATFWGAGVLIFIAFLATLVLLRETPGTAAASVAKGRPKGGWPQMPRKGVVVAMLATGLLLMIANMSIEPIITVYVESLISDPKQVTFLSGLVMSAAALGSIISASQSGKVADQIGHSTVIILALSVAGLLLIPQAFVTAGWQLVALRFLMGLALGGLLPCIAAVIRHNVPDHDVGAAMGWSLSSQFAGQVAGPLIGGFVGGQFGMRAVFLGTSLLMLLGAAFNWRVVGFFRRG